jgi:uncharacterized protein
MEELLMARSNGRAGDVHIFMYRGTQLVYDVNSGSLHQVDDLAREAIELLRDRDEKEHAARYLSRRYPPGEVEEALEQIDVLRKEGLLFSPEPRLQEEKTSPQGVKSLCLFISHSCNLGCRYCFNRRDSHDQSLSHMTPEVGKKAVDFLLQSEGGHFREIDFFGGEPLLNFPLVREIVEYARERTRSRGKEFSFTLTTNATLLDERSISFLNSEDINVILSLDGRPEVHDRMRSFKNGRGSYNTTVKKIKSLLQGREGNNYYIRGTYTRQNLDFTNDIRHFLELGFFSLSMEPVVSGTEGIGLREEDLPALEREYDRLVELYLEFRDKGTPFQFYHFLLDLERGPCLYKRLSGCGAGEDYLAVSADGSLYPCHQFVGADEFYMGNISDGPFAFNREPGEKLVAAVRRKEACLQCWARYLCGGGCAASSYFAAGDLEKIYDLGCALQKIRLERALYLQSLT